MTHLTRIPGVPKKADAKPGMAFYAGTGPEGKTCDDCQHLGLSYNGDWHPRRCAMFKKLAGMLGPNIRRDWPACKYFEDPSQQRRLR
jgi:hypothetical protein